jgi:hypothetical protein
MLIEAPNSAPLLASHFNISIPLAVVKPRVRKYKPQITQKVR